MMSDSGSIADCYATGSVTGYNKLGGLIGYTDRDIKRCYAIGQVSGLLTATGGLIGLVEGTPSIEDCFYDTETTGQDDDDGRGTPKTSADMKTKATFENAGWDFENVWAINDGVGYPYLRKSGIPAETPVASIHVSSEGGATSVRKGNTLQMYAEVLPENATDKSVSWTVEKGTGDAAITPDGLLKGSAAGTITVRATANDGSGVSGTMDITVTPSPGGGSSGGSGGRSSSSKKDEPVVVEPEEVPQAPATVIVLTPGSKTVSVNGQDTSLDAAPFIKNETGRAMVPLRFVSEQMGARVDWLRETRQVRITYNETTILLTIGSHVVLVNGLPVEIDSPAEIVNGRTYVPLRFVSEALGATAAWDETTGKITISK